MAHATHLTAKRHKPIGRHSQLPVHFELAGIDENWTVRVWVTRPDGTTTGPFPANLTGDTAEYTLTQTDIASPTAVENLRIVAVAENQFNNQTLVSKIEIPIADWPGAETYESL